MAQTFNGDVVASGNVTAEGELNGRALGKALLRATILAAYPIGTIYSSTSPTSPAEMWGGTWEQLTQDAYLKIVTEHAGEVGGTSSDHRIPLTSTAPHNHAFNGYGGVEWGFATFNLQGSIYPDYPAFVRGAGGDDSGGIEMAESGGGQPYYPYYYGIYAWHRTA